MGRRKQWPPLPHPHAPSGQERVRINGDDFYLGPIGSQEARLEYARLLVKLAGPDGQPPKPKGRKKGLTIVEVVERWDAYASQRYSKSGKEAQQFKYALRPLVALWGSRPASEFSLQGLEEIQEEMITRGICRKQINRQIVRIRTMWRWAERKGHVPPGSWAALRALPPIDRGDRRVKESVPRECVDWGVLAKVCRHAPPTIRDMLLVQWYTGARSAEIRTMRISEIDRRGDVWIYRPPQHKCKHRGQSREIMLGTKAQRVLSRHLVDRQPGDYVFQSKPGRCYSDNTFPQSVARACAHAGVTPFTPYALRHTFKRRVTRELGLDAARAALGQASLDTTDRYAAGQDSRLARDAARRLG